MMWRKVSAEEEEKIKTKDGKINFVSDIGEIKKSMCPI